MSGDENKLLVYNFNVVGGVRFAYIKVLELNYGHIFQDLSCSANTEHLSPVAEAPPLLQPTEITKSQLVELDIRLKKINSRVELPVGGDGGELPLPTHTEEEQTLRERRVSRFKVSVVNEPDRSKLVLPPQHQQQQPQHPIGGGKSDFASVINTTFDSLASALVGTLPPSSGKYKKENCKSCLIMMF